MASFYSVLLENKIFNAKTLPHKFNSSFLLLVVLLKFATHIFDECFNWSLDCFYPDLNVKYLTEVMSAIKGHCSSRYLILILNYPLKSFARLCKT